MQRIESWKPVVGYEGLYEVSDLGRVRSLDRLVERSDGSSRYRRGVMLALSPQRAGHLKVYLSRDGRPDRRYVHHLVLEAFDRDRLPGEECRHGPGGPADNRWPEAICWGTKSENQGTDRTRDGTLNRGERSHWARLTEAAVKECRRRYAAGEEAAALAGEFNVAVSTMKSAVSGSSWAYILDPPPVRRGHLAGEQHLRAKLTEAIVRECRRRHAEGETQKALARDFNVSASTIQMAICGSNWRHLR